MLCKFHNVFFLWAFREYKLTLKITSRRVRAKITGKLLILCNFDLHHSICTTLLYKILFTEFKNLFWFWFYGIKCKPTFDFLNAVFNSHYAGRRSFLKHACIDVCGLGFVVTTHASLNQADYYIRRSLYWHLKNPTLPCIFYHQTKTGGSIKIP